MSDTGPQTIEELLSMADDDVEAANKNPAAPWTAEPGYQVHFLVAGFTFDPGNGPETLAVHVTSTRGQTIVLTDALIRASRDRLGNSWLDLVDHPELQVERWNEVKFAPGPAPASVRPYKRGSVEEDLARDRALRQAETIKDPELQADAMRVIAAEFGRASTSKTLAELDGGRHA